MRLPPFRPSRSLLSAQRTRLLAGLLLSSSQAGLLSLDQFERAKQLAVEEKWSNALPVESFLRRGGLLPNEDRSLAQRIPVIDVRAPCEFEKGHVPGAISVPLFTDNERAEVGTLYKKAGHDEAVHRGLEIVTAKGWEKLLAPVAPHLSEDGEVLVYCFRGGMRSGSVAWLLSQAPGLEVHTMAGGYKAFRHWSLETWEACDRPVTIVGGPTGSGKTDVLHRLRDDLGAQVLDLEGDANHRGSAFGSLGRDPQPTNEHYENLLALQWRSFEASRPVFIEDESHNVGKCGVPRGLWQRMRAPSAQVLRLQVPHAARVAKLVQEYGVYEPTLLADCVRRLNKKLGNDRVAHLCRLLEETQPPGLSQVADALLEHYYDDMYGYQAKKRLEEMGPAAALELVECGSGDALENAKALLARSEPRP